MNITLLNFSAVYTGSKHKTSWDYEFLSAVRYSITMLEGAKTLYERRSLDVHQVAIVVK